MTVRDCLWPEASSAIRIFYRVGRALAGEEEFGVRLSKDASLSFPRPSPQKICIAFSAHSFTVCGA